MSNRVRLVILALLVVAVAATFTLRGRKRAEYVPPAPVAEAPAGEASRPAAAQNAVVQVRPRLVELGSVRCQACQEMMKVLDALRASQGERLQVDFIDVFEDPAAGDRYGLKMIPTQILFDATGREIFRHVGYFSHDDILAKFRALGVRL